MISVRDINFRNAAVNKQLDDRGLVSVNEKGDRNCFFCALSVCLNGHENKHAELRNSIAKHMSNHSNDIFADDCNSQANREVLHGLAASTYNDGTWAGEHVIKAAAHFLKRELKIFISATSTSPLSYKPVSVLTTSAPIQLGFYKTGHYHAAISATYSHQNLHTSYMSKNEDPLRI